MLNNHDERAMLRSGKRYISNIMIVEQQDDLTALPQDILLTRLNQYTENNIFTGTYAGPGRSAIEETFEQNLARIYESADTPRLSGVQIKAPMYLDSKGTLSPSAGTPFTHILKPAGTSGYEFLPLAEWTAFTIGLKASDTENAMNEMRERLQSAIRAIALPKLAAYGAEGEATIAKVIDICRTRAESFE